jgi:hypothetical protein
MKLLKALEKEKKKEDVETGGWEGIAAGKKATGGVGEAVAEKNGKPAKPAPGDELW